MNHEVEESRGVVAVLTIDDIEKYLWEEQAEKLHGMLNVIEDGRKQDGKKASKTLIY